MLVLEFGVLLKRYEVPLHGDWGPVQMYIGLIVYLYNLSAFETPLFPRHGVVGSWIGFAALPKKVDQDCMVLAFRFFKMVNMS
jgi:hypothetical protein